MSDRNSPKMTRNSDVPAARSRTVLATSVSPDPARPAKRSQCGRQFRQVVATHLALSGVNTNTYIHPIVRAAGATASHSGSPWPVHQTPQGSRHQSSSPLALGSEPTRRGRCGHAGRGADASGGRRWPRPIGRPDDVGEQQHRQHADRCDRRSCASRSRIPRCGRPSRRRPPVANWRGSHPTTPRTVPRDRAGDLPGQLDPHDGSPMLWSRGRAGSHEVDRTSKSASASLSHQLCSGCRYRSSVPGVAGLASPCWRSGASHRFPALLEVGPPCGSPMRGERGVRTSYR